MFDRAVSRSVFIPAPPDDVFDALVDPARLEDWFADEVDAAELVPDAEVVFRWDDGRERRGVVVEVDRPQRLVFRWAADDGEETQVAFALVDERPGTRVTVVETGLTPRSAAGRAAPGRPSGGAGGGGGAWGPRLQALAAVACTARVLA